MDSGGNSGRKSPSKDVKVVIRAINATSGSEDSGGKSPPAINAPGGADDSGENSGCKSPSKDVKAISEAMVLNQLFIKSKSNSRWQKLEIVKGAFYVLVAGIIVFGCIKCCDRLQNVSNVLKDCSKALKESSSNVSKGLAESSTKMANGLKKFSIW